MRDPLKRFLTGAILSLYGDWLTTVAMVVLLVRVTGSTAAPAGYMLARVLPRIVSAGPGGALADRFTGARVVAVCSVVQGVLTATIIASAHAMMVWAIYSAVVLSQLCNGVSRSALGTIIPTVVAESQLGPANALYNLGLATAIVIAPAIGVPLLILGGPDLLLAIDVGTFLGAALLMLTLPGQAPRSRVSSFEGSLAGLRIMYGDPVLRVLAFAYLSEAAAVTVGGAVLVLASADRFGGANLVGILYAAVGAGDIIAGVITLRRRPPPTMRVTIVGLGIIAIVALAVFSVSTALWMAMIALAANGVAETSFVSWGATDMQRRVPSAVLGRANAVIVLAQSLGMILGAVTALILVPSVGWSRALFFSCCGSLGLLAVGTALRRGGRGRSVEAAPVEGW